MKSTWVRDSLHCQLETAERQRIADKIVIHGDEPFANCAGICGATLLRAVGGRTITNVVRRALLDACDGLERDALESNTAAQ